MKSLRHDIWDIWDNGYTICICTNGFVKKNGDAVMGRGLAYEAAKKFPNLQREFGNRLKEVGNVVDWWPKYRIFTFPTKHNWREESNIDLIRKSCKSLNEWSTQRGVGLLKGLVFLPIPGIGNGKLDKKLVMPILEDEFDGNEYIVIVEKPC